MKKLLITYFLSINIFSNTLNLKEKIRQSFLNFDTDIQFVFTDNISPNEIDSDVEQVMKEDDIKNLLVSTSIEVKENKENIRANIHVKYSVKKEDYILAEKKIDEWAKKNIKKNMSDYDKAKTREFEQAMSLYARVSYIKELKYDSYIGYGNTYLAKKRRYYCNSIYRLC